jgi:hypothetical protein
MTQIYSLWAPALAALFLVVCAALLLARGKAALRQTTVWMFALACIGGFVLYAAAYMPETLTLAGVTETAVHAVFSTGRMFLMEEDYGYIAGNAAKVLLVRSILYNILFWACHMTALFVSTSALLGVFGRRFIQQARLRFGSYDSTYLICGASEQALILGRNIATHDGRQPKDRRRLVVYLDRSFSQDALDAIENLDAVYLEYEDSAQLTKALAKAGLYARPGRRANCRLFLLPTDEAQILEQAACLSAAAANPAFRRESLTVYGFSESEWLLSRLEDSFAAAGLDFRLYNQADLSARLLVRLAPPCSCLSFREGVTQDNFTLMILGFDKSGKAALRRLAMTGQFLHSNMRIIVADKNAGCLMGQFFHAYPGLTNYNIEAWPWDVRSEEFYRRLHAEEAKLHYIVVALDSDLLSLDTAQELCRHFLRRRPMETGTPAVDAPAQPDLPVIAVRVRDKKYLAAGQPVKGSPPENSRFQPVCYGAYHDLYTENIVINEAADRMAKAIAQVYYDANKTNPPAAAGEIWQGLSYFHRESNRAAADFFPSMLRLTGLSWQQLEEDEPPRLSQALRLVLAQTEHLRWSAFHFAMGYRAMTATEMTDYARTLAAAGRPLDECRMDMLRRRHICLAPWSELPEVARQYNALIGAVGEDVRDFQQNNLKLADLLLIFARTYHSGS